MEEHLNEERKKILKAPPTEKIKGSKYLLKFLRNIFVIVPESHLTGNLGQEGVQHRLNAIKSAIRRREGKVEADLVPIAWWKDCFHMVEYALGRLYSVEWFVSNQELYSSASLPVLESVVADDALKTVRISHWRF